VDQTNHDRENVFSFEVSLNNYIFFHFNVKLISETMK
jgi:hypothetical protein